MNRLVLLLSAALLWPALPAAAQDSEEAVQHVVIFKESGRFAGWPANNGIWSWGDEIVAGFSLNYYKVNPTGGHAVDRDRPSGPRLARSTDGGETWSIETPNYVDEEGNEADPVALEGAIDFSHPDFAMRLRSDRFYYSLDRCKTWQGPFQLPHFGRPGLLARTDYIVEDAETLTAFVTAEKEEGDEGQPLAIRTSDGGLSWDLVGWIGPQPPVSSYGYAIMPSTVRLNNGAYLSMIRRGGSFDGARRWWVEPFLSPDNGESWYLLDSPVLENAGNPAAILKMEDGRIAMTYGWRSAPQGIRAMVSEDDGQTWGREIVLRHDASLWDIGYPQMIQRADGKLVCVYYYRDDSQPEQFIAATIWDPDTAE